MRRLSFSQSFVQFIQQWIVNVVVGSNALNNFSPKPSLEPVDSPQAIILILEVGFQSIQIDIWNTP
jgi:hypothetical protein